MNTHILQSILVQHSKVQPLFIMLIGAPGSGKSTFLNGLKKQIPIVVASTDDQIDEHAANNGLTYSQAFDQINFKTLKQRMEQAIVDARDAGKHIAVDQTNMHRKSRSGKLKMAGPGYLKIALDFDVPDKTLLERIDARAEATGKNIPRHVVFSMLKSYEAPSKTEGFDHVYKIGI